MDQNYGRNELTKSKPESNVNFTAPTTGNSRSSDNRNGNSAIGKKIDPPSILMCPFSQNYSMGDNLRQHSLNKPASPTGASIHNDAFDSGSANAANIDDEDKIDLKQISIAIMKLLYPKVNLLPRFYLLIIALF